MEPRRFNVIGLLAGESEEQLLFNGHMDTVKTGVPNTWTKPPLGGLIEDGRLYGRGACDMKSGLAAMIFAIEALVKCGITPHKSILFTAVIDEEVFFKGTRALIDTGKLKHCTRAYVSEPTSLCIATSLQGAAGFTARTYFLMNIGILIAISGSLMIVQFFAKIFGRESLGRTATVVLFAVIIVFVYNFCCFSVRNFDPENPNLAEGYVPEKLSLSSVFSSYLQALKVKPFNKLLIITFCVNFAVGVGSSLMIFLYTYVFRYSENKTSFMLLITTLFLLLTTILAGVFANKFGKKQMMIGGMIFTACYLIMAVFPTGDFTAYLYILFYGIGTATYWTLIYSMSYDTALIDKYKSGNSPDGLYTSMIGFFMKAGSAIGMWITGIVLSAIGFNAEAAEQAADTIANLKLAFGIIPAVILATAVIAAIAYSLTKDQLFLRDYFFLHTIRFTTSV